MGGPSEIQLQRFVEALKDPTTKFTYTALSGKRAQSVEDVERLFSPDLIAFMERKGYTFEAEYLKVIRNWRRAVDERGLSDEQRHIYNMDLLRFILDDLMPWHKNQTIDYSLLEVNR